jgi:hypothetical protein
MDPKIKIAQDFLLALRNQEHDQMFSLLSEDVQIVGAFSNIISSASASSGMGLFSCR